MYTYIHTHTHIHTHTYGCVCVCMYIYILCTHTRTYIYTHTGKPTILTIGITCLDKPKEKQEEPPATEDVSAREMNDSYMDDVTDRAGIGIKFKVRMYVTWTM